MLVVERWILARLRNLRVIPSPIDQNRCAQSRNPIDIMVQGWSTSLFQAKQQCSRMSERKTRLESQLSRMNCQTFSTGLSSGHLGGSGTSVMFGGTMSLSDRCHPGLVEDEHGVSPPAPPPSRSRPDAGSSPRCCSEARQGLRPCRAWGRWRRRYRSRRCVDRAARRVATRAWPSAG